MEGSGDDHGAFIEKFILPPPNSSDQQQQQLPLHGLTFAIKDMYDHLAPSIHVHKYNLE